MHYAGKIEVSVFHEAHVANCVWGRSGDDITARKMQNHVDARRYQHIRLWIYTLVINSGIWAFIKKRKNETFAVFFENKFKL